MRRVKGESLIIIIFICSLAFVLGALIYRSNVELNKEIEDVTNTNNEQEESFEIWTVEGSIEAAVNEEIIKYQKEYPNINFKVKAFKDEIYKENLLNAVRTNSLPDMFYSWGDEGLRELVELKAVKNITSEVNSDVKDKIYSNVLENYTIDDEVYGMPVFGWNAVMYCNTALFNEYGLELPSTYDDLLVDIEVFKEKEVTPMAIGGQEAWMPSLYYMELVLDQTTTKTVENAINNPMVLESAPFVRAADQFRKLVIVRPWQTYYGEATAEEALTYFCQGKAAMLVGGSWMSATIQDDVSGIKDNIKVIAFPTQSKAGYFKGVAGYSDGFALNINSHLEEIDVTKMYLDMVKDISDNVVEKKGIGMPIYTEQSLDDPSLSIIDQCYDIFPSGSYHSAYDQIFDDEVVVKYNEAIKNLEKGYITDKKFMEEISGAVNGL